MVGVYLGIFTSTFMRKHVDLFENLCGFLENEEHLENVGFRFVCLIFGNIYHHMRKQDLFENLCKFWH